VRAGVIPDLLESGDEEGMACEDVRGSAGQDAHGYGCTGC